MSDELYFYKSTMFSFEPHLKHDNDVKLTNNMQNKYIHGNKLVK